MKSHRWITIIMFAVLLLSACAQSAGEPVVHTPTPQLDMQPTGVGGLPVPVAEAQEKLASQLGLDLSQVVIDKFQKIEWPDSCLGAPSEGEMCAEVITPGYSGIFLANGSQYEFRVSEKGDLIRFIPPSVLAARQVLAQQLQVAASQVSLISFAPVEWPDSCLGAAKADEMCLQVITPGYRITLSANGETFEFHTDETGAVIRQVAGVDGGVETDASSILWTGNKAQCETAEIRANGLSYTACDQTSKFVPYISPQRAADFLYFWGTFSPFKAETPAGEIIFQGIGSEKASESEQRMIAEWSRLVYQEALGGRGGAAWGLAFSWHREGGLAGFCDDLGVYVTGEITATSCKTNQPSENRGMRLTSQELDQLYYWLDNLAPFEYNYTDPATADALSIYLAFNSTGSKSVSENERQEILDFASRVYGEMEARRTPASDQDAALLALQNFFLALQQGDYQSAVSLFGGSYEDIQYFNPDIALENKTGLWKAVCEHGGLVCFLTVGNVLASERVDPDTYRFTIEFLDKENKRFEIGPCCGADPNSAPPVTNFIYTINRVDGNFLVQDLPPYIP